jgi:hypothetical protein
MLANGFVNKELFAAFQVLEDCADFSDLQHSRLETVRQSLGLPSRREREKKSRCCGGAQPKAFGPLSKMRLVTAHWNELGEERLFALPFIYVAWRVRDTIFPSIEVVEFPLETSSLPAISEQEYRESARTSLRYVRALRDLESHDIESFAQNSAESPLMLSRWIEDARRTVAVDVFDGCELFPAIYFSRLDFTPKSIFEQNYVRACLEAEASLRWDFHQERVLFHPKRNLQVPVRMKTYVVERGEASTF